MNYYKYYSRIVKYIVVILAIPFFVYRYTKHSIIPLYISFFMGIIFFIQSAFKIFRLLTETQNELEVLRVTSEKFNSTIDMSNIVKYIFDVFKKLVQKKILLLVYFWIRPKLISLGKMLDLFFISINILIIVTIWLLNAIAIFFIIFNI